MKTTFHIMTGIITMLVSLTISCMPAADESFRTHSPLPQIVSGWEEKDYEYAQERFGESFNFDRIYEMATLYEAALQNWKVVREQIKSHLPKQKQKSYSEITREINTRLYDDLLRLKKISF